MAIARPKMTEQGFLRLPDEGRKYELVDGEAKEVPATFRHDVIAAKLIARLTPFAEDRGYLASSQAGFRMVGGNIRSPDVSFTLFGRLPTAEPPDEFGDFAPDLCIGIISPSEDRSEMQRKLGEYFGSGAQQVWHLFPETQRVIVYTSPTNRVVYDAQDELDGGALLPGFRCRVAELFVVRRRPTP